VTNVQTLTQDELDARLIEQALQTGIAQMVGLSVANGPMGMKKVGSYCILIEFF
jgi:hypothetical protein